MSVLAVGTSIVARTFVRHRGAFVPICVVALLGVLLFPLPAAVLSLLLLINLALAILIMLTTIFIYYYVFRTSRTERKTSRRANG